MKIAVPDLISNSYFPAVAAAELGFFAKEGLDLSVELIFPVDKAYRALRDGEVEFVAGSAHSALAAFPNWQGAKLVCAQAQGMYWFLVMHTDLAPKRGEIDIVKGRSIGAAPWVEMGLRRLLITAGIDPARDDVRIAPVPGAVGTTVNFGLTAAKALEERKIDASGPMAWGRKWPSAGASAGSSLMCAAATGRNPRSTSPWRRSPRAMR